MGPVIGILFMIFVLGAIYQDLKKINNADKWKW